MSRTISNFNFFADEFIIECKERQKKIYIFIVHNTYSVRLVTICKIINQYPTYMLPF